MLSYQDENVEIEVLPLSSNKDYIKCFRCRNYHGALTNYQGICDRCAIVVISMWKKLSDDDKKFTVHIINTIQPKIYKLYQIYKDWCEEADLEKIQINALEIQKRIN